MKVDLLNKTDQAVASSLGYLIEARRSLSAQYYKWRHSEYHSLLSLTTGTIEEVIKNLSWLQEQIKKDENQKKNHRKA